MTRPVTRLVALVAAVASFVALGLGSASIATAAPPPVVDPAAVPVTGTLADGTGAVDGTFDVSRFVGKGGTLQAVGTFTGTVTDAAGNVTSGTQQVTLPVNQQQTAGSCEILDLVLGPLDLNLLGLMVHLDQVHLNITAQQGPGNLLGNLLCAIAGLLDTSSSTNALAALLNRLLGALGAV